jgi:NAD-dependent dihydropyrimidine dehydrogenase PreA subunit
MGIKVNQERCLGCGCCMDACFQGALELGDNTEDGYPKIVSNSEVCIACEECVTLCPNQALGVD